MLTIKDLRVNYGGIEAVKGISFDVPEGSIVTLIGANGAGKSTTLRSITGLVKASGGSIQFDGTELLGMDTPDIVSRGITLVPEGRRVFPNLTVLENLKVGAYLRSDKGGIEKDVKWVYELFPRLEERHWQLAGTLSGGEQQMLAVGRGLMSRPKMMMLDEPSLGLSPMNVDVVAETCVRIREEGIPVLLVEQNAMMSLGICNRAYVLENGVIAASGTGKEMLENEDVQKAYLGL